MIPESLNVVRWSAHYEGWPFAIFRVVLKATALLGTSGTSTDWFRRRMGERFDKRYGVDTSGIVKPDQLGLPVDRRDEAVEFSSTSPPHFGMCLSQLKIDYQDYTYVDFGSGKGRSLLMASDFPFRSIIGVELSQAMHEAALRNIATYRSRSQKCRQIHSTCCDAASFVFPESPLVLYFFNPFSDRVLREVLDNLQASVEKNPRRVIVVYNNPVHIDTFQACPLFAHGPRQETAGSEWIVFDWQP